MVNCQSQLPPASDQGIMGWSLCMMLRNVFSLCRRTVLCQKLPADFEMKLAAFQ